MNRQFDRQLQGHAQAARIGASRTCEIQRSAVVQVLPKGSIK